MGSRPALLVSAVVWGVVPGVVSVEVWVVVEAGAPVVVLVSASGTEEPAEGSVEGVACSGTLGSVSVSESESGDGSPVSSEGIATGGSPMSASFEIVESGGADTRGASASSLTTAGAPAVDSVSTVDREEMATAPTITTATTPSTAAKRAALFGGCLPSDFTPWYRFVPPFS